MHEVADGHDTPWRMALVDPAGFWVPWTVQLAPFQRSASVTSPEPPLRKLPTAVHAVEEVQDTAFKNPVVFDGVDIGCTAQLVPFHPSASILVVDALLMKSPTAIQDEAPEHDTPFSSLTSAPIELGVAWIAQLAPLHLSASIDGGT